MGRSREKLEGNKSRHEGAILPFPAGAFDVVIGQEAFLHVPEKPRLIAECAPVVRSGGVIAFTDILRKATLEPCAFARLQREMAVASLETLDGYARLLVGVGCTVVERDDISDYWTRILKERLEMYRSLKDTTVGKFGEDHFRKWDDTYAFFVGLFAAGRLGGGRFVARRET